MKFRILLPLLAFAGSLGAQNIDTIPAGMSYQGFLTDIEGNVVGADEAVNETLEFRIYNQATGGAAAWGERQVVTVLGGNFSVVLGNGVALDQVPLSGKNGLATLLSGPGQDFWFGITQQGEDGFLDEFTPRQNLLPSAFAYKANVAGFATNATHAENAAFATNATTAATAQRATLADRVNQTSGSSTFANITVNQVAVNSGIAISGDKVLEFGAGVSKQADAGKIGYRAFSTDALDIVGAGSLGTNRKVNIFAEGGLTLNGTIDMGVGDRTWIKSDGEKNRIRESGNRLYFVANDVDVLELSQEGLRIPHGRSIELGIGVPGKNAHAGKILYQAFTDDSLEIIGAGSTAATRKVTLFSEGGTQVNGPLTSSGVVTGSRLAFGDVNDLTGNLPAWQLEGTTGLLRFQSQHAAFVGQPLTAASINFFGSYVQLSDRRLKEDIETLAGPLETVLKLRPTSYRFKAAEADSRSYGVIAQELQEVLPDLVTEHEGTLSVSYSELIPFAIGAIQEQQAEIESLRAEVATLKTQQAATEQSLATRLDEIERQIGVTADQ